MTEKVSDQMLENVPLTNQGELIGHDGTGRVAIPAPTATGQVLTADLARADMMAWSSSSAASKEIGELFLFAGPSPPTNSLLCDGSAVSRTTYAALFGVIGTKFGAGDGSTTFNVPDLRGRVPRGEGTGQQAFDVSAVNTSTDRLTVPSNETLQTGLAVVYTAASPAAPLVSGTTYYVIRVSATEVQLATTRANAVAGTAIDLTTAGSGTQTLRYDLTTRTAGEMGGIERHTLTETEIPSHQHTAATPDFGGGTGSNNAANTGNTGSAGGSEDHYNMSPYLVAGIWCIYAGA